ncbi:hypothetical protein L614_002000000550 [Ochrobactrum sp. J50]|uniref:RelA/SpoT domain-containing protein n=1 Tax=Ochrobactrum sp. J50 TaxID=936132 RepID=UPI00119D5CE4|nr:RelA/SpoT domain-containing protein [Ochrobactrum sp. J50]TWH01821.1 hypothetical protein L614_002000000550 [Ochrobactrum sp. J50]
MNSPLNAKKRLAGGRMARWAKPEYSKNEVNKAGRVLVDPSASVFDITQALNIINNWRSIHGHPLNTFQTTLRIKGRQIDSSVLVAQRIKRLSSIELKLRRFPTMTLSQMQDIGGCRAILSTANNVRNLLLSYQKSDLKHKLHTIDNYMDNPKKTGYRGIHLIYSYYSDKIDTYNSLKVEMQLRSQAMHAWATAVEIVGTFTRQALKSSQGEDEWLRFFALMGSAIAIMEDTAPVPETPSGRDGLLDELRILAEKLDAVKRLRTYGTAPTILESPEIKGQHFFLLQLDIANAKLNVTGYQSGALEKAASDYLEAEKRFSSSHDGDAVLVSVESIASLRRAYPNYFFDTHFFVELVEDALTGRF